MIARLRAAFALPVYDDPETTTAARVLYYTAWPMMLVVAGTQVANVITLPESSGRWLVQLVTFETILAIEIALVRSRRVRAAALFVVCALWVQLTVSSWTAGGITSPGIVGQITIIALAALLLGKRAAGVAGVVTIATTIGLALAGSAGLVPEPSVVHTPLSRASTIVTHLITVAFVLAITMRELAAARDRAVRELGERRSAQAELEVRTAELERARDEVSRVNAELEERVAARTAELEATVRELDTATRAKSDFLASMSHELRTPLNSIIGFSGLLVRELPGPLNEEQLRQASMISSSGHRLLALVNQVLDLARIESSTAVADDAPFDVCDAARQIAATLAPLAEAKGIALVVEGCGGPCEIVGDRVRTEQILMNLVGNAVRFTDVGGVTVRMRSADGEVRIEVADTGSGMAPHHLEHIFEDFYQIPPPEGGKHDGTGLGLSVSRRLAEMLGATIDVESTQGVGSVFTLRLPRG